MARPFGAPRTPRQGHARLAEGSRSRPGAARLVVVGLALVASIPALGGCFGGGGGGGGGAETPPLTATLTAAPATASVGQQIEVALLVRNNTSATTFVDVTPAAITASGTGAASAVGGGTVGSSGFSLPPGAQQTVVDTFEAAQPGTVVFSRALEATDDATAAVVALGPLETAAVTIQTPAALESGTPAVIGAPARTGDLFQVDVVVTNTGEATARDVTAALQLLDGAADLLAGPSPASAEIAGGGSRTFRFELRAAGQGDLIFQASASGLDKNSALPAASTPSAPSVAVPIAPSAALEVRIDASPTTVTASQDVQVTVTVENVGDGDAQAVAVALAPSLAGALAPASPAVIGVLAAGASEVRPFVFTTQAAGTLRVAVSASGENAADGAALAPQQATAADVLVQAPAALVATVTIDRARALEGELVTVTLRVTNSGGATALDVVPQPTAPQLVESGATAALVTGPSPSEQDIPGGASRTFVYSFNPGLLASPAPGSVAFSAGAGGVDQNLGAPVSATAATSAPLVVDPRPAELAASIAVTPPSVPQDDAITVTLTVSNQGGADALDVAPIATAIGWNGGSATAPASPPAPQTVPSGEARDFVFAFAGGEVGQVTFSGEASGRDAITAATVRSPLVTSSAIEVTPGPPFVTSANPATGSAAGGTTVTLTGRRFAAGMTVTVGGRPATKVRIVSATEAVVVTPAAAAGLGASIVATNPGGAPSQAAQVFAYQADQGQPSVAVFIPRDDDEGVLRNRRFVLSFTEAMDATALGIAGPGQSAAAGNTGDLRVTTFFGQVGGTATLSADGTKLVFAPQQNLGQLLTHSLAVSANQGLLLRDVHGNALTNYGGSPPSFLVRFRTGRNSDGSAPQVTGSTPAAGATGVAVDATLEVRFGEPLDPLTVTAANVVLERVGQSAQALPATVALSADCTRVTVAPHAVLDLGASYRVRVTTNVRDLAQNRLGQEAQVAFTTTAGDQEAPVITRLTLSEVTRELNGTGPAGGTLQVPVSGFTIDLEYADGGGSGIDPASLEVTNSRAIGGVPAGQSFGGDFTAGASAAALLVPAGRAFPSGANTITARIRDRAGNLSAAATFAFQAVSPSNQLRPFETQQVWLLVFTRDLWTTTVSGSGTISLTTTQQANGTADFVEDLRAFGLNGSTVVQVPQPGGGTRGSNDVVQDLVKLAIRQRVSAHYGVAVDDQGAETRTALSANVSFRTTQPSGAAIPAGTSSVPRGQAAFSTMPIGGPSLTQLVIGTAFFDPQNPNEENNVNPFNVPSQDRGLGVFVTEIYRVNVNGASFGQFRQAFDPLIPGRGTPVGAHAEDDVILVPGFDPNGGGVTTAQRNRHAAVFGAIDHFARTVAATTAHECGHSMGLVANDAMPSGLYGNLPQSFPGSNSGHIKLTGTPPFTGGATNLMAPSSTFDESIHPGTRFGSLNEAFLRERVLHGN